MWVDAHFGERGIRGRTAPGVSRVTGLAECGVVPHRWTQERRRAADSWGRAQCRRFYFIEARTRQESFKMKAKVSGFTLIELVVVITILGILSAFAIPKFIALDSQARIATVNGLGGTVKSAAALARGLDMATSAGTTGPVTMEGAAVALVNSYPDSTAGGIGNAINASFSSSDFTVAYAGSGSTATWTKVGASVAAGCTVVYTAAAANSTPNVVITTTGC
jgi:MSHA pilin protein MshA